MFAMGRRFSRSVSKGLRLRALDLMLAGGMTAEVALEVGVSVRQILRWCRHAGLVFYQGRGDTAQRRDDGAVITRPYSDPVARTGHGRRLTLAERTLIQCRLQDGCTPAEIARQIGVHRSTITREIARSTHTFGSSWAKDKEGPSDEAYLASLAQHHTQQRRARPKPRKLHTNPALRAQVVGMLEAKYSPHQAAQRLKHLFKDDESMHITAETIYQELYLQARSVLLHELKVHTVLRSGRTGRKPRSKLPARSKRPWLAGCRLADRDQMLAAEHEGRKVPGHWEGDLVVGPNNSAVITLAERASRFTLVGRLPGARDSETVIDKLTQMAQHLPAAAWRSVTWDQGSEMAQHARFTVATGCPVYFADPHSPWQRPTNENYNGQLRWEFPKGTDFNTITDEQICEVQDMLNARPRAILNGMTPAEKLDELITAAQDGVALTP